MGAHAIATLAEGDPSTRIALDGIRRIVQVHPLDRPFERGAEKSFFCFGGSAIVVFGEPGRWRPCEDILKHTQDSVETLVRLGDTVAIHVK